MNLKGKNILLMMPEFYHLRKEIQNELNRQGANVVFIESKVFKEDFRMKKDLFSLLNLMINPFYNQIYTKQVIRKIQDKQIDVFLCIGVFAGSKNIIGFLKKHNPHVKTIIYFWDAFVTWDFSQLIDCFDSVFTFDRNDYKKFQHKGVKYLPLFYVENKPKAELKYDLSHIGTLGPKYKKRMHVLYKVFIDATLEEKKKFIRSYAPELNSGFFIKRSLKNVVKCYLLYFFDNQFREYISELKKYKDCGFIFNDKLSSDLCEEIERSSKCILDVNIENAGSAFRIIKALSMGIKVITTNKHIVYETYYSNENIDIIDKDKPVLNLEFINSPFKSLDVKYLRIDNWLKTIIEFK